MPSAERRERERQETRQLILDTARELFVREGYESVSMRKIADRIEYSAPAIYHHFRDKQALITELCLIDFQALAAAFLRIGRIDDPVERIGRIGRCYVEFAVEHPEQFRFMFMSEAQLHHDDSVLADKKGNPEEDAYAFLRLAVREAIDAGRLRPEYGDAELVSQLLWAGVHGVATLHVTHAKDEWIEWREIEAVTGAMVDVTLRGLLRSD